MPESVSHELSPFEKIEILRSEIEDLEEKLRQTEAKLRSIHFEVERLRYLASLAKPYAKSPAPDGYSDIEELETKRKEMISTLKALKAALPQAEAAASGKAPPAARREGPAAGAAQKRRGFQSFDDFRSKRS